MRYFILSGSHREKSQSRRVADYFQKRIQALFPSDSVYLYSLEGNPLPLWDEGIWNGTDEWKKVWGPVKAELEGADALIVISPEWGGMATPGVKNFLLLCAGGPISHKPGLIVTVSASRNGAYPVSELRMNTSKNNQICYIPEHIIVRNAPEVLAEGEAKDADEKYLRGRIDYSVKLLREYGKALKGLRESGVIDAKNYPFGM
jgi:NAD(P)H-dependent FMN reductase